MFASWSRFVRWLSRRFRAGDVQDARRRALDQRIRVAVLGFSDDHPILSDVADESARPPFGTRHDGLEKRPLSSGFSSAWQSRRD
jgi:hypothetical protein